MTQIIHTLTPITDYTESAFILVIPVML